MFSRLIPPNKTSEFFGFYAVAERFATVLGPLVFTVSVLLTGSSRFAVLFIVPFFAAGALLLSRVDEAEGSKPPVRNTKSTKDTKGTKAIFQNLKRLRVLRDLRALRACQAECPASFARA